MPQAALRFPREYIDSSQKNWRPNDASDGTCCSAARFEFGSHLSAGALMPPIIKPGEPMHTSAQAPRGPRFSDHVTDVGQFRVARWHAPSKSEFPPLLFFTGIGANAELLAPFLDRLANRDIVTFDMPGIGGSPNPHRPYRLSAMASAANQILSDLKFCEVDVMGVSWGGMFAQEFAYRYPRHVGKLILAATSAGMPIIPGNLSTLAKMASSLRYADPAAMLPYLQSLYGGSTRDLDTYALRMQAPSSKGYLYQLLAIAGWTSVRKLTQVPTRTLILMGSEDRLLPPSNGRILKFLLGNAQLEILEDAGHLFVLTHADAVVTMIDRFLTTGDSVSRSRSAADGMIQGDGPVAGLR
ncbi:alpha/beta fold hydrolase [Novosphingobium sp. G106]|uniref:alpha/beta fold hydrolase n=1 Tax=Novosphingobium sp. G106 TaxID=2849500 RepID=UPI001C2D6CBA|nr:alpha/beta fold hydrolase [Novosphingobium sp. G106]MBV1688532.1 alpha/beta fold hydrolase [Novosphingobium sp. G106]